MERLYVTNLSKGGTNHPPASLKNHAFGSVTTQAVVQSKSSAVCPGVVNREEGKTKLTTLLFPNQNSFA